MNLLGKQLFTLAASDAKTKAFGLLAGVIAFAATFFSGRLIGIAFLAGIAAAAVGMALLQLFFALALRKLLTGKAKIELRPGIQAARAKAKVTKILSERNAKFFDAGEKMVGARKYFLSIAGLDGNSSLFVCTTPFLAVRFNEREGKVALFYGEGDSEAETLAEVIKTKVEVG